MAIQKLSFKNDFRTQYLNISKAISKLTEYWEKLSTQEKETWADNSIYAQDKTGRDTFLSFYMGKFGIKNPSNSLISTLTLTDGTSKAFADRTSRTLTAS